MIYCCSVFRSCLNSHSGTHSQIHINPFLFYKLPFFVCSASALVESKAQMLVSFIAFILTFSDCVSRLIPNIFSNILENDALTPPANYLSEFLIQKWLYLHVCFWHAPVNNSKAGGGEERDSWWMRNENKCILYKSKAMIITAACVEALNNQTHEAFVPLPSFLWLYPGTAYKQTNVQPVKPDASSEKIFTYCRLNCCSFCNSAGPYWGDQE